MSSEPTHLLQCAPTQKQSVKKERKKLYSKRPPGGQVRKRSLIFIQKKKPKRIGKRTGKRPITTLTLLFFSIAGGPLHPLFFNDTVTSQLEQMEEEKKRPTL